MTSSSYNTENCSITKLPNYEDVPWITCEVDWDNVSQNWMNTNTEQCSLCAIITIHANIRSVPNCGHICCIGCYYKIKRGWGCFCWKKHPYNIYFDMAHKCGSFEE